MGILQQGATSIKNVDDARSKVESAIVAQVGLVADLYDASGGTAVFLADTNALYHNPDLDAWRFPETPRFVLLLPSTALKELDEAKVNYRNPDVQKKAEGLIGRVKSYSSTPDPSRTRSPSLLERGGRWFLSGQHNLPLCRTFKPSDGLEPSTPSLPWRCSTSRAKRAASPS